MKKILTIITVALLILSLGVLAESCKFDEARDSCESECGEIEFVELTLDHVKVKFDGDYYELDRMADDTTNKYQFIKECAMRVEQGPTMQNPMGVDTAVLEVKAKTEDTEYFFNPKAVAERKGFDFEVLGTHLKCGMPGREDKIKFLNIEINGEEYKIYQDEPFKVDGVIVTFLKTFGSQSTVTDEKCMLEVQKDLDYQKSAIAKKPVRPTAQRITDIDQSKKSLANQDRDRYVEKEKREGLGITGKVVDTSVIDNTVESQNWFMQLISFLFGF